MIEEKKGISSIVGKGNDKKDNEKVNRSRYDWKADEEKHSFLLILGTFEVIFGENKQHKKVEYITPLTQEGKIVEEKEIEPTRHLTWTFTLSFVFLCVAKIFRREREKKKG